MIRSPYLIIPAVLILLIARPLIAQQDDTTRIDRPAPATEPVGTDTAAASDSSGMFRMTKSPTRAVLWGLIPGGGQVYTEQYWKVPIFVVPIAALTAVAIHFEGERSAYDEQAGGVDPSSDEYRIAVANRNTNQDRRDLSIAVASGVFILSLIDAYSSAHLYDFDVGDSLAAVRIYPDPVHSGIGVAVRW